MGWDALLHDERTFRCVRQTREGELSVYVRIDDNWMIASIVPFLVTNGNRSFELSRWLLRMNRDMFQVKFAHDQDGDVVMTVELPLESLDRTEIQRALRDLVEHAVRHRQILREATG